MSSQVSSLKNAIETGSALLGAQVAQPFLFTKDLYRNAIEVFNEAKKQFSSFSSEKNEEAMAKLLRAYIVLKNSKDPDSPLQKQQGFIHHFFSSTLRQHYQRIAEAEKVFELHFQSYIKTKNTLDIDSPLEKRLLHQVDHIELTLNELGVSIAEWNALKKALIHGNNGEGERLWNTILAQVRNKTSVYFLRNSKEAEYFLFGTKQISPFTENETFHALEHEFETTPLPIDPAIQKEWSRLQASYPMTTSEEFDRRVEAFVRFKENCEFLQNAEKQKAAALSKEPPAPEIIFKRPERQGAPENTFTHALKLANFAFDEVFPKVSKTLKETINAQGEKFIQSLEKAESILKPGSQETTLPIRGWIPLEKNNQLEWMYIDQTKAEIAFIKKDITTPEAFTHLKSELDHNNQVITTAYTNLLTFYKVDREKLASNHFVQHLRQHAPQDMQKAILSYLQAKELPVPDPKKSPHLLVNASSTLSSQDLVHKMFLIEAVESGAIKADAEESLFLRAQFFGRLDTFISEIKTGTANALAKQKLVVEAQNTPKKRISLCRRTHTDCGRLKIF